MKSIKNILILVTLILVSCSEDFLSLSPEDQITSGNFYKTKEHFEQALNATYGTFRGVFNANHSWMFGEQMSDNCHFIFNSQNRPVSITDKELADQFLLNDAMGDVADKYNSLYSTISSANFIIAESAEVGLEENEINSITGQAKFIRAYCYFDLVRFFGAVPLYLEPVKSEDNAFLPRSPVNDVYQQIIADASDAASKLDAPTFPQKGYASKSSARMLLGDVYLTLKQYELALAEFQAITTYGHDLLSDYASVYELSNKNSIESIFEIQHLKTPGLGQANSNTYRLLPSALSLELIVGFSPSPNNIDGGFCMPTSEMIATYEDGDERLPASIAVAEGTGIAPINFSIEAIKSPVSYTTPEGKSSYPYVKKYVHEHDVINQVDDNVPVYRYSEALLSLAETLNELNRPSEALPYLNEVRQRAGLADVTETSQAALRDIILHEKRVELAFENKRWLDLVRTDKAIDVLTAYGEFIKANFETGGYVLSNGYQINQNKLLLPIPEREIRIGNLEQNPGYE